MQNQKLVKWIQKKLIPEQILIGIEPACLCIKSNKKTPVSLVITTKNIYYVNNFAIERRQNLQKVQSATLSVKSMQMVIHTFDEDDSWLQSQSRTRILKNFLHAKEKFMMNSKPFPVNLALVASLQDCIPKALNRTGKFFKQLFRLGNAENSSAQELKSRQSDTFLTIHVTEKDFKLQIGAKIYQILYKNIKLLYTSGSDSFRFIQENYDIEDETPTKIIYREKKSGSTKNNGNSQTQITKKGAQKSHGQRIILRKINKGNQLMDKSISEMLQKYRNLEYKEEILFAIDTETHFQIITKHQRNLYEISFLGGQILQAELRSIFHRLINLIEGKTDQNYMKVKSSKIILEEDQDVIQNQKLRKRVTTEKLLGNQLLTRNSIKYQSRILHSLCPQNVFIDDCKRISISVVFSSIQKFRMLDYLAPEEFYEDCSDFDVEDIELINLWKVSILIYEIAYGNTPFTVDYIAYCAKNRKQIEVNFPLRDTRSNALQSFLKTLLVLDPTQRGGVGHQHWKDKVLKSKWMS